MRVIIDHLSAFFPILWQLIYLNHSPWYWCHDCYSIWRNDQLELGQYGNCGVYVLVWVIVAKSNSRKSRFSHQPAESTSHQDDPRLLLDPLLSPVALQTSVTCFSQSVSLVLLSKLTSFLISWSSNVAGNVGYHLPKIISDWRTRLIAVHHQMLSAGC